jgi:hypothetical protein
MAKKKKDSYPDIIQNLIMKRDVAFKNYKADAIKVAFNEKLVAKYFPYPFEGDLYGSDTKCNLLEEYELLGTDITTQLTANDYLEYISSPYVSKKLYNWVNALLKENEIDNPTYTGTVCIGILRFKYWHDVIKDWDSSRETRKKQIEDLDFFGFIEKYQKDEVSIKEIKIKVETEKNHKAKDHYLPIYWFNEFYNAFMYKVNTSGLYTPESYINSMKLQAGNWIKHHPTTMFQQNKTIRKFVLGFDCLLKDELKISISNKRNIIIGYTLSDVGILPSLAQIRTEKLDRQYNSQNEYLADRVREYVRRGKK